MRCGFRLGADDMARGVGGQSDRMSGKLLITQWSGFQNSSILCFYLSEALIAEISTQVSNGQQTAQEKG